MFLRPTLVEIYGNPRGNGEELETNSGENLDTEQDPVPTNSTGSGEVTVRTARSIGLRLRLASAQGRRNAPPNLLTKRRCSVVASGSSRSAAVRPSVPSSGSAA